jgi:hypothetical protein
MRAWMLLSSEKFHRGNLAADRRAKQQAAEESPEQHFARVAAEHTVAEEDAI